METSWAAEEMAQAQIGDERSRGNLIQICSLLAAQPGISFSVACGESKRKSGYRLFQQKRTTPQGLLYGHYQRTVQRCKQMNLPLVLVASDTTSIDYTNHKATKGLGPITTAQNCRGFLTHSALALTTKGIPIGLLHQKHIVRPVNEENKNDDVSKNNDALSRLEAKKAREREKYLARNRPYEDKESYKWLESLYAVEDILPESQPVLMIQDREADIFEFLNAPRRANTHLLIRAAYPRRVIVQTEEIFQKTEEGEAVAQEILLLFDAVNRSAIRTTHVIEVGRKPDRPAYQATLEIKYIQARILPSRSLVNAGRVSGKSCEGPLVWIIQAREKQDSFSGKDPLCWVLISTLPVIDELAAITITQYYAYRWQIERFHFVLKSGCQVEKLQIDTVSSLQKALSIYSVVAWFLLYLTYLGRSAPDTSSEILLDPALLQVVSAGERHPVKTAGDLIFALGKIGGFRRLPSAPFPGVKSLWLGLRRLHDRYEGWKLAYEVIQNAGQD